MEIRNGLCESEQSELSVAADLGRPIRWSIGPRRRSEMRSWPSNALWSLCDRYLPQTPLSGVCGSAGLFDPN